MRSLGDGGDECSQAGDGRMIVDEAADNLVCIHFCCVTEGAEDGVTDVRGLQAEISYDQS